MTLEEKVRRQTWHYLEPDVAAVAGMTLANLQAFIAHQYTPTAEQLQALARRMGVT